MNRCIYFVHIDLLLQSIWLTPEVIDQLVCECARCKWKCIFQTAI